MRLRNSAVLAGLVWLVTAATPVIANADSSVRAAALHDLATHIYATAYEASHAHDQHRALTDVAAKTGPNDVVFAIGFD